MREIKTLSDVEQVPATEWIVGHSRRGKCPYCGKALPVYQDCCVRYGTCDCEVAKAVAEHNKAVIENKKK